MAAVPGDGSPTGTAVGKGDEWEAAAKGRGDALCLCDEGIEFGAGRNSVGVAAENVFEAVVEPTATVVWKSVAKRGIEDFLIEELHGRRAKSPNR